jgi:transposase
MDRYIGLDAHTSSCTIAVIGQSGKRLHSQVVETNAKVLIEVIRSVPKDRHLCLEEGPHSNWLYEVLSPHVEEIVVALVNESRGPKNDKLDAIALAEQLRIGAIRTKVYKKRGSFGRLGYRVKAHALLVADSVRVQSRIKALLRSRGVAVADGDVYSTSGREEWLSKLPESARSLAELLYMEYDGLEGLRQRAEREMMLEARKHDVYRIIQTCPGIGEIRAAQILPVVVTPFRFANKRVFWSYCGLGIVMRSSSDWVRGRDGQWIKAPVQQTRGLNRNFSRPLKGVFKGAATTVIGRAQDELLYRHYVSLLDGGTKPNLAKLTIARQIAAIVLALWRSMEVYDPHRLGHAT